MIYGQNTKACEFISDGSSDPNKWSHSWEMRKPIKTTEKMIIDSGDGAKRPFYLAGGKLP